MCSSSHMWARIGGGKKLTVNRVGTQAHSPIHEGDEQELEKVAVVVLVVMQGTRPVKVAVFVELRAQVNVLLAAD